MIEVFISLLAIIAVVGVSIYFFFDFKNHKDKNETEFQEVSVDIRNEKKDRLSNLKYVVDQVNTTNKAMDTAYNTKFTALTTATNKSTQFETGFGSIIGATDANNQPVALSASPASAVANIKLMKKVSVLGGMTINDVSPSVSTNSGAANVFKACSVGVGSTCIEFPNSNGDIFLTTFAADKSIILGSPTSVNANLTITGTGKLNTKDIVSPIATDSLTLTSGTSVDINSPIVNISKNITGGVVKSTIAYDTNNNLVIAPTAGKDVIINGAKISGVTSTSGNVTTTTAMIGDIPIEQITNTNTTPPTVTIKVGGVVLNPPQAPPVTETATQ